MLHFVIEGFRRSSS